MWQQNRNAKYNNKKVNVLGRTFHSKLEAGDGMWLKSLEQQGVIQNLEYQKRFNCYVNGDLVCYSIVDFKFNRNGKEVYYETKGMPTPEYKIKRKLIMALLKGNTETYYLVNSDLITIMEIGAK